MFICILLIGCFLAGCDEDVKKDPLEKYIYVNKSSLNMFYGDKMQLKANPAGESFEWTSADPAVATITADGLVEAVGVGSTEITVSQGTSQTLIPVSVAIPTVDKVVVAGENGRLQIAVQILSERITTVRIIWNNDRDVIDIPVDNQSGIFTRTVDYSGENGYVFQVVSFDRFGNSSASSETTATLIRNRDVSSAWAMDDGLLTIQWGNNTQYVDHCLLSYVNRNGQTVSRKVLPSETATDISGYSSDLSLVTLFMLLPSIRDTFRVEAITPTVMESTPFNGPHILSVSAPCEVEARDFDYGGEGRAFHEVSNRTPNSSYRTTAGDELSKTVDIEGGGNLGYVGVDEWLIYTLEVQDAGVYAVDVRLSANNAAGGSFYFSMDGVRSETTVTPNQGGWSNWIYVFDTHPEFPQPTYRLSAGKHKFRFTVGPGGFNLMGYKFTYVGK
jgi:hypothetical protein